MRSLRQVDEAAIRGRRQATPLCSTCCPTRLSQPIAELPDTGVGLDLERLLAPIFIRGEAYGTRASTLAYARADGACVLVERGFGPKGAAAGRNRGSKPEGRPKES